MKADAPLAAAPGAPSGAQLAHIARYQLLTLAVMVMVARRLQPEATTSLLEGGGLVALNLQLSRVMLPLMAALRARAATPARQMLWVGLASIAKLGVQLAVAAAVLLHWPPAGTPFLVGLSSFVGGGLGAIAHGLVALVSRRPAAARRGAR